MKKDTITITQSEYRPCMVSNKRALFHRWEEWKNTVSGGFTIDSPPAGQISYVVGIVEFEDGAIKRVYPEQIRFIDGFVKSELSEYALEGINNEDSRQS